MAKTEAEFLSEFESEVADRAAQNFRDRFEFLSRDCESPIEKVLLGAFMLQCGEGIRVMKFHKHIPEFEDLLYDNDTTAPMVGAIYAQVPCGPYRADFLLCAFNQETTAPLLCAAIECDGHEFHEKTKEQARRDKQRDRWFQSRGIRVFRFTGSEIWADPIKCADEVLDAAWSAYKREFEW